ncbi:glycine cleavage system aminomethyltransferase GcvT [Microbacterium amylolyticum]|uniref:Aminomethyltransferase n=1 Tax=Microbacterium amylolyticum TaxID=936337 RepID=A0ABS4ZKC3_9MICO|nr:glycine cleavage system aminomethyltransferase GcvT [Microbacterium amylolyticum]MBP2437734.1 aminomethyltransferase [Microbacterium amylolyticum]
MTPPNLRETPLTSEHIALGAALTDFGGWRMPVRYTSDLAEHHAVRQAAGLFDVSHMGEILVTGPEAADFLDYALAGRISSVAGGRAKYTMILDATGGIIDDLIVYRMDDDRFLIVANAGNRDIVARELQERVNPFAFRRTTDLVDDNGSFAFTSGTPGITIEDVSDSFALIALQGPAAHAILPLIDGIGAIDDLDALKNYAWCPATFHDAPLVLARTGYTGEDGFEMLVPAGKAVELWRAALAAGAPHGLVPAGLAARDTLRLEAGMPLYGSELTRDTAPWQAGLERVIPAGKAGFVGEQAQAARPDARILVGLVTDGRRAGRSGYAVLRDDQPVGVVTSGALSPTLGHPIAMAYIDADAADAEDLAIDVRGTPVPARITTLPFYRRSAR